jgi:hypothetical protein
MRSIALCNKSASSVTSLPRISTPYSFTFEATQPIGTAPFSIFQQRYVPLLLTPRRPGEPGVRSERETIRAEPGTTSSHFGAKGIERRIIPDAREERERSVQFLLVPSQTPQSVSAAYFGLIRGPVFKSPILLLEWLALSNKTSSQTQNTGRRGSAF